MVPRFWGVPKEAYLECMNAYLDKATEYGWYLCLDGEKLIGGLGVIENDFHDRKDLSPNICAVYTDPAWHKVTAKITKQGYTFTDSSMIKL